jgi:outer membrane biosynthesis protein TonB
MTTALSLAAGVVAMLAVLTTFAGEARADGANAKQGGATAQVLAEQSKPGPQTQPAAPKPHATANAKAKAQPKAKVKAKTGKTKPHAKPAKAPAKPAKPGATARA